MVNQANGQPQLLVPVTIYGSLRNHGDGSAGLYWCLTLQQAQDDQANMSEGWGEECIEIVETYAGSRIWNYAVDNFDEYEREKLEKSTK